MKWLSQLRWGHSVTNNLSEPPPPHADTSSPAAAAMQEAAERHVAIPSPSSGVWESPHWPLAAPPPFHRHCWHVRAFCSLLSAPYPPPTDCDCFPYGAVLPEFTFKKNPNQPQNPLLTLSTSTTWGNKLRRPSTCSVKKATPCFEPIPCEVSAR